MLSVSSRTTQFLRGGIVTAAVTAVLAIIPASAQAPVQARVTQELNGRSGPGTQYGVLFVMPADAVVPVFRCTQDIVWCEVQYGAQNAWAAARFLEVLPGTPQPAPQPGGGLGGGALIDFVLGQLFGQPPPPAPPPPTTRSREPAANEVCFFKDYDFAGDFFCVRMGQSDINLATDWNDQISSLRVGTAARIEVCGDINYGGWCQDYVDNTPQLGSPRNDAISSYRAVAAAAGGGGGTGGAGGMPPPPPPPPVAQICFYEGTFFSGTSFCMGANQSYATLPTALNNRISSIRIEGALAVQICADYNYNGWCEELTASVSQLPSARDNAISSLRVRNL